MLKTYLYINVSAFFIGLVLSLIGGTQVWVEVIQEGHRATNPVILGTLFFVSGINIALVALANLINFADTDRT
jgi:hypothetical protein